MFKARLVVLVLVVLFGFSTPQFLIPSEQSLFEEVFRYNNFYEYVISKQPVEWTQAVSVCFYAHQGWLATLETDHLKSFAVEAMSESNMNLDGLWVGLVRTNGSFRWLDSNVTIANEELAKCGNSNCGSDCSDDMDCGALIRANHTVPCLINLRCEANRGFICKRPTGEDPSTHKGWIKIRRRLYKIFSGQVTYDQANIACMNRKLNARLAVVETFEDAQKLKRYLLVGRPSLERVWIGARWEEEYLQYMFEGEAILLANVTDTSGYPPWRRGRMTKPFGCLLLDRHLSNISYFVESKCNRLHSYMCYKLVGGKKPVDICDVGDYDWRVYYEEINWFQASEECKRSAPSGRIAVVEEKDLKYFIYIMESSKRYLVHCWLGAYFEEGEWIWSYTNRALPKVEQNGYPPWVVNKSYDEAFEKGNLCLNIDRENTIAALFYGTLCDYAQTFVCQYDKGTICPNGSMIETTEGSVYTIETSSSVATTAITESTATASSTSIATDKTIGPRTIKTNRPTTSTLTTEGILISSSTTVWPLFKRVK